MGRWCKGKKEHEEKYCKKMTKWAKKPARHRGDLFLGQKGGEKWRKPKKNTSTGMGCACEERGGGVGTKRKITVGKQKRKNPKNKEQMEGNSKNKKYIT